MKYDPNGKMLPKLNRLYFFESESFKKSNKPEILEDGSWVIEGEFLIYDEKIRDYNQSLPFYKKKIQNKDGDTGCVFPILVCSPSFVKNYKDSIAVDTVKPIVFDKFNEEAVENYINEKLGAIGEVTFDELIECLDKFSWAKYDMEEYPWPDSMNEKLE